MVTIECQSTPPYGTTWFVINVTDPLLGFYSYRGAARGYYGDQSHYTYLDRLSIL